MRVLDLGCGSGCDDVHLGVTAADEVVGVDVLPLANVAEAFPGRHFVRARAESLPFREECFDKVACLVAMPYMNIPQVLGELERTLKPGGQLRLTLHAFSFTIHEFFFVAFPRPKAMLFRLWVMLNGITFYFSGRSRQLKGRYESFQSERGMRIALNRSGFRVTSVTRPLGEFGPALHISAEKIS